MSGNVIGESGYEVEDCFTMTDDVISKRKETREWKNVHLSDVLVPLDISRIRHKYLMSNVSVIHIGGDESRA